MEEHPATAGAEPAEEHRAGALECFERGAEPPLQVAHLGGPAREDREDRPRSAGGSQEMGERVRALRELDGPHPRLVVEDVPLEEVDNGGVHPGPEEDELAP